jgi:dynein intermediate chain 1, axonemal
MCFDFNKFNESLFLVGTKESKIHLCSKAYSCQYLETYEGHYYAVYAFKWDTFHPRKIISCSADWSIKKWDKNIQRPIKGFDLGCAIGDTEWVPYSSTVLSAVKTSGNIYVWDLSQEKHTHKCEHSAVKKAKALKVSFNKAYPIILIGYERGSFNSFILSKQLTRGPTVPTKN